jgi:hypothetical protein
VTFRPPPGASARRAEGEPRELEWPPGSGRRATYSPEEQVFVLGRVAALERFRPGNKTRAERLNELVVLHELKVEFGAELP